MPASSPSRALQHAARRRAARDNINYQKARDLVSHIDLTDTTLTRLLGPHTSEGRVLAVIDRHNRPVRTDRDEVTVIEGIHAAAWMPDLDEAAQAVVTLARTTGRLIVTPLTSLREGASDPLALHDLRGSSTLFTYSDFVLAADDLGDLTVIKNRYGPSGVTTAPQETPA